MVPRVKDSHCGLIEKTFREASVSCREQVYGNIRSNHEDLVCLE